jgi:succinate dehydrogenase / fumarate reductase cytochrome b subunit
VYHLANGLWTQGITWGLWTTQAAMRRAGWICLAFGLFLGFAGLGSLFGFSRLDVPEAERVEQRIKQLREIESGEAPIVSLGAPTQPGK